MTVIKLKRIPFLVGTATLVAVAGFGPAAVAAPRGEGGVRHDQPRAVQAATLEEAGARAQLGLTRRDPEPPARKKVVVGKRLYIGGMSYSTTDDELGELFEPFGTVTFAQVTRNAAGQGKGFGFVEMSTPEEARGAIEGLNGSIFQRRTIIVAPANPSADWLDP